MAYNMSETRLFALPGMLSIDYYLQNVIPKIAPGCRRLRLDPATLVNLLADNCSRKQQLNKSRLTELVVNNLSNYAYEIHKNEKLDPTDPIVIEIVDHLFRGLYQSRVQNKKIAHHRADNQSPKRTLPSNRGRQRPIMQQEAPRRNDRSVDGFNQTRRDSCQNSPEYLHQNDWDRPAAPPIAEDALPTISKREPRRDPSPYEIANEPRKRRSDGRFHVFDYSPSSSDWED